MPHCIRISLNFLKNKRGGERLAKREKEECGKRGGKRRTGYQVGEEGEGRVWEERRKKDHREVQ